MQQQKGWLFLKAKAVFAILMKKLIIQTHKKIKEIISSKTKAIIPVSLYGQPADMDEINGISKKI